MRHSGPRRAAALHHSWDDPLSLKWPGTTMSLKMAPGLSLEGLATGIKVASTLSKSPQGAYVIEGIQCVE